MPGQEEEDGEGACTLPSPHRGAPAHSTFRVSLKAPLPCIFPVAQEETEAILGEGMNVPLLRVSLLLGPTTPVLGSGVWLRGERSAALPLFPLGGQEGVGGDSRLGRGVQASGRQSQERK